MEYYVSKDGQNWGPYSEAELKQHVASGSFSRDDLAWHDGQGDWAPIHSVVQLPSAAPPPAPQKSKSKPPKPPKKRGCFGCLKVAVLGFIVLSVVAAVLSRREDNEKIPLPAASDTMTAAVEATKDGTASATTKGEAATAQPEPIQPADYPKEVKLKEVVVFKISGSSSGSLTAPEGTSVSVEGVENNELVLKMGSASARVPQSATNFQEQAEVNRDKRMAEEERQRLAEEEAKKKEEEERKAQQAKIIAEAGEKPVTSGWDNSVRIANEAIKATLNDASSFEIQNSFNPMLVEVDGQLMWRVKVVFRAKNAFGAKILKVAYVFIRKGSVVDIDYED